MIKLLRTAHKASFEGRYYRLAEALCKPKPVQRPHPPLWIGGAGEKPTMRVVAKRAGSWNTFLSAIEYAEHGEDAWSSPCLRKSRVVEEP